jgi:hypothetical protein
VSTALKEPSVTIYAHDPDQHTLLVVWPKGNGYHAAHVVTLAETVTSEQMAFLCEELTELSARLWKTYTDLPPDDSAGPDLADLDQVIPFSQVTAVLRAPNLPDETGTLRLSYNDVEEASRRAGRALLQAGIPAVTEAVIADVEREIDAVKRAELGDLTGRAAQATSLDRVDASPVQVVAADSVFEQEPLGDDVLFTSLDPASACVAAAHWLTSAAVAVGNLIGIEPASVFAESDNVDACSVDVPQLVVAAIHEGGLTPHDIVTALLRGAARVRDGEIPDLDVLIHQVAEAQEQAENYPDDVREQAYEALMPTHLTPLDPRRSARDLLEHLLDGLQSANTLFHAESTFADNKAPVVGVEVLPHPDGRAWPAEGDLEDPQHIQAVHRALDNAFATVTRDQAALTHTRLM